jgi:hypothetical protein
MLVLLFLVCRYDKLLQYNVLKFEDIKGTISAGRLLQKLPLNKLIISHKNAKYKTFFFKCSIKLPQITVCNLFFRAFRRKE